MRGPRRSRGLRTGGHGGIRETRARSAPPVAGRPRQAAFRFAATPKRRDGARARTRPSATAPSSCSGRADGAIREQRIEPNANAWPPGRRSDPAACTLQMTQPAANGGCCALATGDRELHTAAEAPQVFPGARVEHGDRQRRSAKEPGRQPRSGLERTAVWSSSPRDGRKGITGDREVQGKPD